MIGDVKEIVAFVRGPGEAFRRQKACDPDGWVRLLVARGQEGEARHGCPEPTRILQRRVGPGAFDELYPFLQACPAFLHVDAKGLELIAKEAAANTEIESPLR